MTLMISQPVTAASVTVSVASTVSGVSPTNAASNAVTVAYGTAQPLDRGRTTADGARYRRCACGLC